MSKPKPTVTCYPRMRRSGGVDGMAQQLGNMFLLFLVSCVSFQILGAETDMRVNEPADEPKSDTQIESGLLPLDDGDADRLNKDDYPAIALPAELKSQVAGPTSVWRTRSGYIASFDLGEFGGALYFAADGASRWTKILSGHG